MDSGVPVKVSQTPTLASDTSYERRLLSEEGSLDSYLNLVCIAS